MSFEQPSLPEDHTLPLNVQESERHAEGAESTVWKALVNDVEAQEKMIALKQIRREQFADIAEMKKSKDFYESLKMDSEFGKFVPDTLYFVAQMNNDAAPQGYMLQEFMQGKSIDSMTDEELYGDPALARELLDFAHAAGHMLEKAKEEKRHKPDLGTAASAGARAFIAGNYLLNPRYSTNVMVGEKPNEEGRRVFFVDTGTNVQERESKMTETIRREAASPIQILQLKRWARRLEKILAETEKAKDAGRPKQIPAESEG